MSLPPRGHGEGGACPPPRGSPVSLPGMLTGLWSSSHPVRWAGGSSLPPGASRGLLEPTERGRVWGTPLCKRQGGTRGCATSLGTRAKLTGEEGTSHKEASAAAGGDFWVLFLICPPCSAVTPVPVGLPSSRRVAGEWLRHWAAVGSPSVRVQLRVPPWMPSGGIPNPSQSPHRPSWEHFLPEDSRKKLAEIRRGCGDTKKQTLGTQCP